MNNTEFITVFKNISDIWDGFFYKASVYFIDGVNSEHGGVINEKLLKIRIPSDISLDIKTGDRVALGRIEEFDYENTFFISEVSENLKGSQSSHIRLTCR